MTANSFRKMLDDKAAKRADAMKIEYKQIHVEPGFNARDEKAEDYEADLQELYEHIVAGGKIPPIEVRLRDKGGVFIVDGHRRHAAIGRAIKSKKLPADPKDGKYWVATIEFSGNDAERTARVATSARHRPLSVLETAAIYKRLAAFGWSAEDIAKHMSKSAEHVRNLLKLGNADTAVQQMVKSKKVSASQAVKVVKQHGEGAAAVLAEAATVAAKTGKKKVTDKTLNAGKKEAKEAKDLDLQTNAALFLWLEQHAEFGTDILGRVEITFELKGTVPDALRAAVLQGLVEGEDAQVAA